MFSVQKYFSHDAKFFDLLEASADETQALTRLLVELLKDRSHPHPLHEFALARDKDKHITEQISQELVNTFVTGLEPTEQFVVLGIPHGLFPRCF